MLQEEEKYFKNQVTSVHSSMGMIPINYYLTWRKILFTNPKKVAELVSYDYSNFVLILKITRRRCSYIVCDTLPIVSGMSYVLRLSSAFFIPMCCFSSSLTMLSLFMVFLTFTNNYL